jgi:hypothetical protein
MTTRQTTQPGQTQPKPLGELKTLVSLVDRSGFDEYVYPTDTKSTKFQPESKPYHNFTQETIVLPFAGSPTWGQRITFTLPMPWQGDFLNWIALRLKPLSWYTNEQMRRFGTEIADWVPVEPQAFWIWAKNLGSIAIAKAEMEVDGIILEQFSGDWLDVWNKTMHSSSRGAAYDQAYGSAGSNPTRMSMYASEDGYVYATLPFWFAKHVNTAFPLVSCAKSVRFHITLRPFSQVVRKVNTPINCDEIPQGSLIEYRDYSFPFRKINTLKIPVGIPAFESADILCGISYIDGPLRKAYIDLPHELLMEPVVEATFSEPLKYVVNTSAVDTIKIGLPLTMANGPIRQLLFFLRRKAVSQHNDWTNYSATLETEQDPVWNPERPLLKRAELLIGTAVWADEEERWWRATPNLALPGGIRGYGNYIYGYNFADKPANFDPSGSLNASRADMRLNLTVSPPSGILSEWTVSVFLIGTNWLRFENGLANVIFMT